MKNYITIVLALFTFTLSFSQTEKEKVISTVNKSTIEGHIYFLADDLLKGRETGTPENKIAASYLANTLRSYGVKPNPQTGNYLQPVSLEKKSPPKTMSASIDGYKLTHMAALTAAKINYDDKLVFLGHGLEADYEGKKVKNKMLVVLGGSKDASDARGAFGLRKQKAKLAKEAGASGIIELIDTSSDTWSFIDHNFNGSRLSIATGTAHMESPATAHIWAWDEGGKLAKSLASGKHKMTMEMEDASVETIISQNVIGIVEGTDPVLKNEYIIYSAHYDHVGVGSPDETGDTIYNGARDNAVGTTTVLSMAENLALHPTKRSALFIMFTGEEKGLLGSSYYVENPVLPLNQMVYCFNSDNAGYNNTSKATIIGLPRTTVGQHIIDAAKEFGLTAVDDPAPEQGLFDRSDNVNFAAKGIPAPTYSLGFDAFDGDVTKYYHQPGDEADSIDFDYLEKFFKSYVFAGRKIGNDPVTPFWTPGDKYEAAGKKLYNR